MSPERHQLFKTVDLASYTFLIEVRLVVETCFLSPTDCLIVSKREGQAFDDLDACTSLLVDPEVLER